MQLKFDVVGQNLAMHDGYYVVSDSENYITAKFTFSEDWDNISEKHAVFRRCGADEESAADVTLSVTGNCAVPASAVMYPGMRVYVYGTGEIDGETVKIYTNVETIDIVKSGKVNYDDIDGGGDRDKPSGGGSYAVDDVLSPQSSNPVENKTLYYALSNKVNKVSGKALSSNDFTSAYKAMLDTGPETDWNETDTQSAAYINNKPDLSVYATVVALEALANQASNDYASKSELHNDYATKLFVTGGYTDIATFNNGMNSLSGQMGSIASSLGNAIGTLSSNLSAHKNGAVIDHPDGSVTREKIADGAINWDKLAETVQERINAGGSGGVQIEDIESIDTFYTLDPTSSPYTRMGTYQSGGGFVVVTGFSSASISNAKQWFFGGATGGQIKYRTGQAENGVMTWGAWTVMGSETSGEVSFTTPEHDGILAQYQFDRRGRAQYRTGALDDEDIPVWSAWSPIGISYSAGDGIDITNNEISVGANSVTWAMLAAAVQNRIDAGGSVDKVGDLSSLTTTAKTNAVAAINEIDADVASLTAAVGSANAVLAQLLNAGV